MDKKNELYQIILNNYDFDNRETSEEHAEACLIHEAAFDEFAEMANIRDIPLLMPTMRVWNDDITYLYIYLDKIIGIGVKEPKEFVEVFLNNIQLMYSQALVGIEYILQHIILMDIFKIYLQDVFLTLSINQKKIFKEAYEQLLEWDRDAFAISEIDAVLKDIE